MCIQPHIYTLPAAAIPDNEVQRQSALDELALLDSAAEAEFDALAQAAALVCGVPISLISLVDRDRQWFKANVGLKGASETPRESAFCAHAILDDAIFEVGDASKDPRFSDNPLVTGEPNIRFYAGAPLRLNNGSRIGTLCVIDRLPRQLDERQREVLRQLAIAAVRGIERRQAALAFAHSQVRFKTLSEAAPLGVFETDAAGSCVYTNPRWQEIFSLGYEQSLGDNWSQHIHPEDGPRVLAEWGQAAEQRREADIEFRLLHPDHSLRHVRSVSRPIFDSNGQVSGHIGSVEDVSEKIEAERALDQQHRRLASIIEGMGAGTWEWNIQTGETRFNHRWAEIIGFSLDQLAPVSIDTWSAQMHPDDLAKSQDLLKQHFTGELPSYELEARMRHRDGHWVWVVERGRVLTWTPDGRAEWMFGIQLDISARKQQENALRRNEQLLNRIGNAAGVGGWELDLISGELLWTDETRRIHGVDAIFQPSLANAIECYAPQSMPVIQAAVEQAMIDGEGWNLELLLDRPDGARIWVRAVGNAEFEAGKPVRLLGALQDITERVEQRHAIETVNERFRLATSSGGIGVWDFDLATRQLEWDTQTFAIYGRQPQDGPPRYREWRSWLHPLDRDRVEACTAEAIAGNGELDIEFRSQLPDGRLRHLRTCARVTRTADGLPLRVTGMTWDVTDSRVTQQQLAEQRELLQVTLGSIADAVITTDARGHVSWLNPVAEQLTGWTRSEAEGRASLEVFRIADQQTRALLANPIETCLRTGDNTAATGQTLLFARSGREFGIDDSVAPIRDRHGVVLGCVLVFRDVSEQRKRGQEMSFRATHDTLTKLVNRAEFEDRLARTLQKVQSGNQFCALLFIDLDHFKAVNDTCGHAAGDLLLQQVGELLGDVIRSRDTLARIGGDEFAVILEHCSMQQAEQVASKICARMDEFRFSSDHHSFRIGASIGAVLLDRTWATAEAAMRAADQACYAAKKAGRNRVRRWHDGDLGGMGRQAAA